MSLPSDQIRIVASVHDASWITLRRAATRRGFSGFSLLELLVATGIIALLIGLVWSGLQQVIARSRESASVANLRRLSQSLHLYVADRHGAFPFKRLYGGFYGSAELWREMMPYIDSPYQTLRDPGDRRPEPPSPPDIYATRCSYASNDLLTGGRYGPMAPANARQGVLNIRQVTGSPHRIVLFMESDVEGEVTGNSNLLVRRGVGAMWFHRAQKIPAQRYRQGCNFVFLDGSGRWIKTSQAPAAYTREFDGATFSPFQ